MMRRDLQQRRQRGGRIGQRLRLQLREPHRRAALAGGRAQIEQAAAADGALAGSVAQHEAIPGSRGDRMLQYQLHEAALSGRDRATLQQHDSGADFCRGMKQPDRHPLHDGLRLRRQPSQLGIDAVARRMQRGIEHDVAARNGVPGDAIAGEIQRATLAGRAALARPVLRVDRANPRRQPRRRDRDAVIDRDRARQHGAGHHRAGAGQRERTVHRQPETAVGGTRTELARDLQQLRAQCRNAFAGRNGDGNDARRGEPGRLQYVGNFLRDLLLPRDIDQIGLGQRDNAAFDVEQVDDGEVFAGLRLDAVIGGNHQHHEIDAGGPRQHVVDEAFMAGHIDEAEHRTVGIRQIGEAEIDRDAARLLFRQPVGLDAGQRAHQRGLAVIDMAGGADDHGDGSGSGSGSGSRARCSASAISAGVRTARVGSRNFAASELLPARARSSQTNACK